MSWRTHLFLVAMFFCFGLHYYGVAQIAKNKYVHTTLDAIENEDVLYLPKERSLRVLCLDYREFCADWLWMRTINYASGHLYSDQKFVWLYKMLNTITDLDPHFMPPYKFGSIYLGSCAQRPQDAIALLDKGIKANPDNVELPYQAAITMQLLLRDDEGSLKYLKQVIEISEKNGDDALAKAMKRWYIGTMQKDAHQKGIYNDVIRRSYAEQYKTTTGKQRALIAIRLVELDLRRGAEELELKLNLPLFHRILNVECNSIEQLLMFVNVFGNAINQGGNDWRFAPKDHSLKSLNWKRISKNIPKTTFELKAFAFTMFHPVVPNVPKDFLGNPYIIRADSKRISSTYFADLDIQRAVNEDIPKAINKYKNIHGQFPRSLNILPKGEAIIHPYYGMKYIYNSSTGAVSSPIGLSTKLIHTLPEGYPLELPSIAQ